MRTAKLDETWKNIERSKSISVLRTMSSYTPPKSATSGTNVLHSVPKARQPHLAKPLHPMMALAYSIHRVTQKRKKTKY